MVSGKSWCPQHFGGNKNGWLPPKMAMRIGSKIWGSATEMVGSLLAQQLGSWNSLKIYWREFRDCCFEGEPLILEFPHETIV